MSHSTREIITKQGSDPECRIVSHFTREIITKRDSDPD